MTHEVIRLADGPRGTHRGTVRPCGLRSLWNGGDLFGLFPILFIPKKSHNVLLLARDEVAASSPACAMPPCVSLWRFFVALGRVVKKGESTRRFPGI